MSSLRVVSVLAAGSVAFAGLLSCNESGFSELVQKDVFQQSRRNAVDLLVTIDNSCSMVEEQDNLARNFNALISTFTEADVDWQLAVVTTDTESDRYRGLLMGGDDELVLRGPSGEIERVAWDRRWTWTKGTSLQLDPAKYVWNSNDTVANWCPSTTTFGESKGTPGTWNPGCDGTPANPPTGGTDDGPLVPTPGKLVISEIMAASIGLDSKCEWFELTNTSDDTLNISGFGLTDLGRNAVVFPDNTTMAPYGVLVVGRSTNTSENCGTPVDIAFPTGLSLAEDIRVINRDTPDKEELFSELVSQGTIGSGIEQGLEGARLVFEEPQFTASNQGFLRDGADLSFLFVSDEQDLSPYSADAYVRYYTDLKGDRAYRDRSIVSVSAVVGKDAPPNPDQPSCQSASGFASYGSKYLAVVSETNGLAESICAEDFAPIVTRLGLTLSGLSLDFELRDWPQLDTLVVELYAGEDDTTPVATLVEGVDYSYVAEGNKLHFDETQVPPSEYFIVATYEVAAAPNVDSDSDTDGAAP